MCEKVGYATEKQAKTAINHIGSKSHRNHDYLPRKCYLCPDCKMYHITKNIDYVPGKYKLKHKYKRTRNVY